jgi:hypothetical protein
MNPSKRAPYAAPGIGLEYGVCNTIEEDKNDED